MISAAPTERPPEMEDSSAEEVLEYLVDRYHPRLYVACSFQKEASVIMDMLLKIEPTARFFTLDTDVLFEDTYATWRSMEEHYGIQIDAYRAMSLGEQAAKHGDALWAREPDKCCGIRKVSPLKQALSDVDCWVAGLRREQSDTRRSSKKIDWDLRHGLWKANPLADWSERDVWDYIARHDVPYNDLHDRGYESIGCTHCTVPSIGREGRWAGDDKTECGLH